MNCCRMVLLRVTCATENREIIPSHNKSRACGKSPDSFKNWFNPNNQAPLAGEAINLKSFWTCGIFSIKKQIWRIEFDYGQRHFLKCHNVTRGPSEPLKKAKISTFLSYMVLPIQQIQTTENPIEIKILRLVVLSQNRRIV